VTQVGMPCIFEGCDGRAVPLAKEGRFANHRGVVTLIPANIVIPRCQKCGRDIITPEVEKMLTGVLEAEYQRHAHIIKPILERRKQ